MDLDAVLTPWQVARLWTRVQRRGATECWPWQGYITDKGYGHFSIGHDGTAQVHVVAFTLLRGPIPDGLTLDHECHSSDPSCPRGALCQHRRCCNPWHMEPVTLATNVQRGRAPDVARNRERQQCRKGHPLTAENRCVRANGRIECRVCNRVRARRSYRQQVGA